MSRRSKKKVSLPKVSAQNTMRLQQDGPTPERLAKLPGVTILQKKSGARVAVFAPGVPKPVGQDGISRMPATLERLEARQMLAPDVVAADGRIVQDNRDRNTHLFTAGDMLRNHWYRAGLAGSVGSPDLNRSGGGNGHPAWLTPAAEDVAFHRGRFRWAAEAIEPGHFAVAHRICCLEGTLEEAGREDAMIGNRDGATAVALDRLRRALEFLAIRWGLMPPWSLNDNAAVLGEPAVGRVRTEVVRGDRVDDIIDRMVLANGRDALGETG